MWGRAVDTRLFQPARRDLGWGVPLERRACCASLPAVNDLKRSDRWALSLLLVIMLAVVVVPIGAVAWQLRRLHRSLYTAVSCP
ncbi:MAG TPA: hypothetical protein VJJ54_01530 [Gemmatimonadales bacterium]|nr:hypothetical protein [Gemmatimonadales bacterium]